MRTLIFHLVIVATAIACLSSQAAFARVVPPRAQEAWQDRVAKIQAEYAANPNATKFQKWQPLMYANGEAVVSGLEAGDQDGILTEWWCSSSGNYDAWDEMWMAIIAETVNNGAEAYVYLYSSEGDGQATTLTNCKNMIEQVEGIDAEAVHWIQGAPTDAFWMRDFGPLFVRGAETDTVSIEDPDYYPGRPNDDDQPIHFANYMGVDQTRFALAFEGGNFLPNGNGLCLVGDVMVGANPQYSTAELEVMFELELGCTQLVIVESLQDYATGHIDMWLSWADETTLIVGEYKSEQDPTNRAIIENALANELSGLTDPTTGDPITTVRLPMPSNCPTGAQSCTTPLFNRTWRTYLNVLQINGAVLVPVYAADDTYEDEAVQVWESLGYTVRRVLSDHIIPSAGSIHCIAKNLPGPQLVGPDPEPTPEPSPEPSPEPTVEPEPDPDDPQGESDGPAGCSCELNGQPSKFAPLALLLIALLGALVLRRRDS